MSTPTWGQTVFLASAHRTATTRTTDPRGISWADHVRLRDAQQAAALAIRDFLAIRDALRLAGHTTYLARVLGS